MQKILSHTNTKLQKRKKQSHVKDALEKDNSCGLHVAKLFIYYRMLQNPHRINPVPLKLISGKTIYKKYKKLFDEFAQKATNNKFDVNEYIKWCVINRGVNESCLSSCLSSTVLLFEFCKHMQKKQKYNKIYKWFMKSVKNIIDECIKTQTYTTKDFLRELIRTNKIGPYVAAGKISIYYFAAIPSFSKVIDHLDIFSKQELHLLKEHFNVYHSEINEAFLAKRHKMANPIELTDLGILKALKKQSFS